MCWEPSFPPNSVFLPHRLLAHYTTCLPFEERFTYLLTMRAFRERGGWWGVETQSYAVLKVKWAKDLCFVHPSADLKPPAIEILVRFSLKFSPPPEQAEVISLLQLQLHLFISLISPSPICTCALNSSRQSHSKLSSTPCTSCHQPV